MTGVERIAVERQRQLAVEGYNAAHDQGHAEELAQAAACYAVPDLEDVHGRWPWAAEYWKPSPDDRVRELEKAGALIAAAIDDLTQGVLPWSEIREPATETGRAWLDEWWPSNNVRREKTRDRILAIEDEMTSEFLSKKAALTALVDLPAPVRFMLDGSPCWCVSSDEPHEGWIHSPVCEARRD